MEGGGAELVQLHVLNLHCEWYMYTEHYHQIFDTGLLIFVMYVTPRVDMR